MTLNSAPAPPLSRRLARRSLDLLVVGFLATVGVSTGQQLIEWWRVDPAAMPVDLSSVSAVDVDWTRTPVTLRFGDAATALQRIPFEGSPRSLDEELTRRGKLVVDSGEPPTSPPTESERDWLKSLQSAPPVFWDSTLGNVYRRHQPLPSFVATRFVENPRAEDDDLVTQRIVGWGLAFPTSASEWVIYVFRPQSAPTAGAETRESIAPPAESQNITQLEGSNGNRMSVFQGRGDLASWVQHFDRQFGADAVVSRDVDDQQAILKYRRSGVVTDIQIRSESDGHLTGVIWSSKERGQP